MRCSCSKAKRRAISRSSPLTASISTRTCAIAALSGSRLGGGSRLGECPADSPQEFRGDARKVRQGLRKPLAHRWRQRFCRDPSDQHEVVAHAPQRARHGFGIGILGEVVAPLARRFIGDVFEGRQREPHLVVACKDGLGVRRREQPCHEIRQQLGQALQNPVRRFAHQRVGARRKQKQRYGHPHEAAEGHFDGPQGRGEEWPFGCSGAAEQEDDGRDRRHAVAGLNAARSASGVKEIVSATPVIMASLCGTSVAITAP